MGEEWAAEQPFPFFCDFEPALADKVRDGRSKEFAGFHGYGDELPDPCADSTFASAKLDWSALEREPHRSWLEWYRHLLALLRANFGAGPASFEAPPPGRVLYASARAETARDADLPPHSVVFHLVPS